jgi:GAF domain-containing protein
MTSETDHADTEAARLAAVRRYDVLDTPPDGAFDRITRIASAVFGMPIAIVSIVDHDRIWFKSAHGLTGVDAIDRVPGLCASAILQDDVWAVEDAAVDPRTLANPLVAGEFGLRCYAGSPLRTSDGFNLGTLCVIDREPREFTDAELAILDDLAAVVVDELELRLAARRQADVIATRQRQAAELNDDVIQTLTIARLALQLGRVDEGVDQLAIAIDSGQRILAELADGEGFRRSLPAD